MTITDRIRQKLTDALAPSRLEIVNDSERHAGHAGLHDHILGHLKAQEESHFSITIVASAFEGQSLVSRHRIVNDILKDEMVAGVHALSLRTLTPMQDLVSLH